MSEKMYSFHIKGKEYHWDDEFFKIKEGNDWILFTGMIDYGSSKQWYENGLRHKSDGPAHVGNGEEIWYYQGKRHRLNGPAIIRSNKFEEYWIEGMRVNKDQWLTMARKIKLQLLLKN